MRVSRRQFGLSAAAALGAPLLAAGTAPAALAQALGNGPGGPGSGWPNPTNQQRAVAAYQAMQQQYYVAAESLYHEDYPQQPGNAYSYLWPFSQAMAATEDMLGIPGIGAGYLADARARMAGLAQYLNPAPQSSNPPGTSPPGYASYVMPPLGGGGDIYYDDDSWVGLAGLQRYLLTGDKASLTLAKTIFTLLEFGWDTNPAHADPGGTFWTQGSSSTDRNTISNAPGAEIGARLTLITRDPAYLNHAEAMFAWVDKYLAAPNGLYYDHLNLQGVVQTSEWSYNQGVMAGAATLLFQATGQRSYLQKAVAIADAALGVFQAGGRLYTQSVIFDAIFFRNLLLLSSVQPDPRYQQAMQQYADTLWEAVDPQTGLLALEPYQPIDLLDQAGLVQLYALLAWNPRDYGKIT